MIRTNDERWGRNWGTQGAVFSNRQEAERAAAQMFGIDMDEAAAFVSGTKWHVEEKVHVTQIHPRTWDEVADEEFDADEFALEARDVSPPESEYSPIWRNLRGRRLVTYGGYLYAVNGL